MKNEVQELAVMTTSDVTKITPKIISSVVEEIARESVVWAQFYKVNRDLMSNGGTEVVFPKKASGIVAGWGLTAGQGLAAGGMSFNAVTIPVTKGGVGIGLYGEAIRQTNRDVISDCLKEGGMVWAETLDIAAFEAMFPTQTATACNKGTFVATTVPIMGVKSVNPSTIAGFTIVNLGTSSSITYASDVVGTITYWYAPSTIGYANCSAGDGSLTAKDLRIMLTGIQGYKYHPNVLVAHPERVTDILYDASVKFLEAGAYGANQTVLNGEIGQIWGCKLIVSVYAPTISVVAIDTEKLGYQVVRKELDMQRDEYTGMSLDALYFWGFGERAFGVVNDKAYGAVVVKGTYAVSAGIGSGYP